MFDIPFVNNYLHHKEKSTIAYVSAGIHGRGTSIPLTSQELIEYLSRQVKTPNKAPQGAFL